MVTKECFLTVNIYCLLSLSWTFKYKILHVYYTCISTVNVFLFFAENVAPPKKPPRPGAAGHLSHLTSLCPVDSYNEGVKV